MNIGSLPQSIELSFPLKPESESYFAVLRLPYRWTMEDVSLCVDVLTTDGASIPNVAKVFTGDSFSTINLYPAIPHDAAYNGAVKAEINGESIPCYLNAAEADDMFRSIRDKAGGRDDLNFWQWIAIRANSLVDPFRKKRTYPTWEKFKKDHPNGIRFSDIAKINH